jgi:hypothetical protein
MPPHYLDGEPHAHTERPRRHREPGEPLRIGIGGPVGSGKTALVAALCRQLRDDLSLAVLTNDIYTTEDADFLRCPTSGSPRCRRAAARPPRSATTSPPTLTPSTI